MNPTHRPVWDRGDPIDPEMMRFTVGDDWEMDRRLLRHDLIGSKAHCAGLLRVGLIEPDVHDRLQDELDRLIDEHAAGRFDVQPDDEDMHSAVERRLIERIGDAGKRLHTARSRNEQVGLAVRLWLRETIDETDAAIRKLVAAALAVHDRVGALPLPGYTHLRRAMPSSVGDWIDAHAVAFEADALDLDATRRRIRFCPLGSGSGYGFPVELDRNFVAHHLGFDGPEDPVTATQHGRGRAELAYLTALEGIALDLGKLAADLWIFTSHEFGFIHLPPSMTTGSSLMPQKRNPDLVELVRAQSRLVVADRAALLDILRDLPSGYHRDFQLVKGPLFRAHDRVAAMLPLVTRLLTGIEFDEAALREAAADPALGATGRVLDRVRSGEAFRDAYRDASRGTDAEESTR